MNDESTNESGELAPAPEAEPLPIGALRLRCDPKSVPFDSTADIEPLPGVIGQDAAIEALRFGLQVDAPGQNVFVRGLTGTGRMTLISRLLDEIRLEFPETVDRCYVHNFSEPHRPRLITLPRGKGPIFRRAIDRLVDFIRDKLAEALKSEAVRNRQNALERKTQRRIEKLTSPFEKSLREAGFGLSSLQVGPIAQAALIPIIDGKTIPPEEWERLRAAGEISYKEAENVRKKRDKLQPELRDVIQQVNEFRHELAEQLQALREEATRSLLGDFTAKIEAEFPEEAVQTFLEGIVNAVAARRNNEQGDEPDPTGTFRVNTLLTSDRDAPSPMIVEDNPNLRSLLGTMEQRGTQDGGAGSDHLLVRAGSLLRADGGYLILDARDLLRDPKAWQAVVRTLRTGRLEIAPQDFLPGGYGPSLTPEPIKVNLKVVLLGDEETYHLLDGLDPDFPHLFKVLADFDSTILRDTSAIAKYGGVIARIVKEKGHPHFERTAVAALVEHGARIAGRQDRLTTRFGRLVDIAHEAAFVAKTRKRRKVDGDDVRSAIRRTKERAGLPSKRFQDMLADGTIRVATTGSVIGQVNGLAVSQLGPLTFGFPTRITATIGVGSAGVINIEREADLSGSIHTKGFHILRGLLRHLLRTGHPLAFDASIAFEQSYGGIDGDSASTAEICCLLSALTDIPIRQDLAITGAIDQFGNILAIGAANEKIEGFFDTCKRIGLTGSQGVIIPKSSAPDLMLRDDVVEACKSGRFRVYTVDCIHEALELLTGVVAGERDDQGSLPDDTLLGLAVIRAFEYWVKAVQTVGPVDWQTEETEGNEQDAGPPSAD